MRSQIAKKILMETSEDLKKSVRKRANDIIIINKIKKMELISRKEAIELLECSGHMLEALVKLGLNTHDPINNNDQYSYDKEEVMELKGLNHGALVGFHGLKAFLEECEKWKANMNK